MHPKIPFRALILLLLPVALFSCKNSGTGLRKNITGNAGEVVVVISKASWQDQPGEVLRQSLAQEHPALPQDEPLFDLVSVPRDAFKSIFKSTRNIIQTQISPNVDSARVTFKDDVWASPQATVIIQAKDKENFVQIFRENEERILNYFLDAERERLIMNYSKYYEKGIFNVLSDDFNLTMKTAPGFQIAEKKENFIWLRYETPDISQGIVLYTFPYTSDSTFTGDYLISVRDSVFKANIPGPSKGSYMATEKRIDPLFRFRKHNGNYATEMRGLWRLRNDFMGGPYISLAELDLAGQRVVVAFGYVYAPNKDKRNLLRQVAAMIYTMKFNNQKENDQLNRQMEMEFPASNGLVENP